MAMMYTERENGLGIRFCRGAERYLGDYTPIKKKNLTVAKKIQKIRNIKIRPVEFNMHNLSITCKFKYKQRNPPHLLVYYSV